MPGHGMDAVLDQALESALANARKHLEKARPDQYELYLNRSSATKVDSKDQKVEALTRAEDVGLSVRLKRQNRVGFSFTTSLDESAIARAVESALQVAEVMPEEPDVNLGGFDPKIAEVQAGMQSRYDEEGLKRPIEEKIATAMKLEKLCRGFDKRITNVRSASFAESLGESILASHEGVVLRNRGTHFSTSIACKAEENGDAQMGYEYVFSNFMNKLDVDFCARSGAESALELLGATQPKSMKCPAVIRNDVVSDLIDFLAGSFSGEGIEKGKSLLQGKFKEKIFSDFIDIIDDGLMPGGLATRPFDAEGTVSQTTALIKAGVFNSMLLDRKYAKRFKSTATGNSSRGVKSPPSISTTNLYLKPGSRTLDQLIQDVGNGILITNFMALHTANSVTGSFSLGASGILIKNGKLDKPVKGFAVAGNVLQLFKEVKALGSDLRFFGTVGAPSLMLPEITVSGE